MKRVVELAAAAKIAEPTAELCLIAGLIISMTEGKPKQVAKLVTCMRSFVDTQKGLCSVVRLRGAEYDPAVLESMDKAAGWLERMEPFLLMMSRR